MLNATVPADMRPVARLIPGYDPFATAAGCEFDNDAARDAVSFFHEVLCHVKGAWAGQRLVLQPWQQAIVANLFGWKRPDGTRRYRKALIFVPRKNGKSLLAAGLTNFVLFTDNEPGAELYSAAAEREQARLVFQMVAGQIAAEPLLRQRAEVFAYAITANGASYKAVSADAGTKHGYSTHLAVVDELHAQPNRNLVDALETSVGARRQPLIVYITTSDFERPSICNEIHNYASKVRDGLIEDPAFLPVVYEAKLEDDWTAPETWRKANPNLGISVPEEFIAGECRRAQENPAFENTFKRLYLNLRTEQAVRLIPMDQWDACCGTLPPLDRAPCWAGLDLATVSDLAALVLVFPLADGRYAVRPWFWCPRATATKREKTRVPYQEWARRGFIELTDTETTDFGAIIRQAVDASRRYDLRGVAYDPWNATHVANQLESDFGIRTTQFRQGYLSMNEPTKMLLRLLAEGKLLHDGNPVLRWMASNTAGKPDAKTTTTPDGLGDSAGNLKPDKSASGDKIDGIVATIMGLGLSLTEANKVGSIYDIRDMLYV